MKEFKFLFTLIAVFCLAWLVFSTGFTPPIFGEDIGYVVVVFLFFITILLSVRLLKY